MSKFSSDTTDLLKLEVEAERLRAEAIVESVTALRRGISKLFRSVSRTNPAQKTV